MHIGQRCELKNDRLGCAGEAGQCGGKHKRQQLVAIGIVAQRYRSGLAFADRFEHLSEWRMDDAMDKQKGSGEDGQDDVVEHPDIVEIEQAEELAPGHGLNAILAVGKGCLQTEKVDHLRQRQRDHGEVDALATNGKQSGDDAEQGRCRRPHRDGKLGREAPHLRGMRGGISGHSEKHRVAERQQTPEADQEVERAGEQRHAQHVHKEHRINHCRSNGKERDHHHGRNGGCPAFGFRSQAGDA